MEKKLDRKVTVIGFKLLTAKNVENYFDSIDDGVMFLWEGQNKLYSGGDEVITDENFDMNNKESMIMIMMLTYMYGSERQEAHYEKDEKKFVYDTSRADYSIVIEGDMYNFNNLKKDI